MTRDRRTSIARELRQRGGKAEQKLWSLLRAGRLNGLKFRRQHPVGRYFVDFACEGLRLAIELDGGIHQLEAVALRDAARQVELEALGWTVLRFDNAVAMGSAWRIRDAVRDHARALGLMMEGR